MIHKTAIVETEFIIPDMVNVWAYSHICEGAKIYKGAMIGEGVHVGRNVIIGENVRVQNHSILYEGVEVQDNVFIGPNVITTNDTYPRTKNISNFQIKKTLIKKGASIGANATILCGITIGENAMIGAGSVITKDVPENEIWAGNPAKFIRKTKDNE